MAEQQQQPSHQVLVKAVGAATAGAAMLLLSGLTLAGTVVGLTLVTPLLVIFSPVLVPAGITVVLIGLGFMSSAVLGLAAVAVLSWIYRYVMGQQHPPGADQLEHARMKLAGGKARDVRERVTT